LLLNLLSLLLDIFCIWCKISLFCPVFILVSYGLVH
jgi:hypothetical protein